MGALSNDVGTIVDQRIRTKLMKHAAFSVGSTRMLCKVQMLKGEGPGILVDLLSGSRHGEWTQPCWIQRMKGYGTQPCYWLLRRPYWIYQLDVGQRGLLSSEFNAWSSVSCQSRQTLMLPGTESTGVEWYKPEGALGAPLDSWPRCATGAAAAPSACPAVVSGSFGPVPKDAFPLEACSFKYPGGALRGR